MDSNDFQTDLDDYDQKKRTLINVCEDYSKQEPAPLITDEQLNEHAFFQTDFPQQYGAVLQVWLTDGTLSDEQKEIFRAGSDFLWKLIQSSSNASRWLSGQTQLIDLTDKCLNEIGAYGYYINMSGSEDPGLGPFDWLIRTFEQIRCEQLLPNMVKCVTSRFYTDAVYSLIDVNANALNTSQRFLLVTCPNYILICDKDRTHGPEVLKHMLPAYGEIFDHFLPHIKEWTVPVILTLVYPIRFMLGNIPSLQHEEKTEIYRKISKILQNKANIDMDNEKGRNGLLFNSLCLLLEAVRTDEKLLQQAKTENDENSPLFEVLEDFSKNELNNRVRLKALELVSILVPEEKVLQTGSPEKVAGFYVTNLAEALQNGDTGKADEILSGLRELVQNDDVKNEVVKQNGLPSIIKFAKETTDDPLPLEITYAMTFNPDAKKVFQEDEEFVSHIRGLKTSEKKAVSRMASGIMWKLEGEDNFKKHEEEKKQQKAAAAASSPGTTETPEEDQTEKYDMMISYCWAQQALCHKINDRLEAEGFKVWLDRDEMHGSIVEAMAEAIENSRFVLICMSSNYKKSTNCKAEAEYAFNRKSKIVPLIVEPGYKADGWLGFLAGSKIYVDFADKEDEEFDKAYELLIAELERNGLRDKGASDNKVGGVQPTTTTTKPEKEEKPEPPPEPATIKTREYLTLQSAADWEELHVKEFFTDQELQPFLVACESMDGPALIDFYQSCQTFPDKMFALLNNRKEERPIPLGLFFKFISRLKKYLPAPIPTKVQFHYNYIYPPNNTDVATPPS